MRELDSTAITAKLDSNVRERLIKQQEYFILKCASKISHRYITKSDDEWSISLLAFSQAIDNYDQSKGSFLSFTELVIKRRLIDYIKSQGKYNHELFIDPTLFDTEPEEDSDDIGLRLAVAEKVLRKESDDLKYEIEAANQTFAGYGFSFFDLAECSPHASKTKAACAKAVNYILQTPLLVSDLRNTRQLQLKTIEKNIHIPRKILERHRKYIIAAIEILSGDYPYLAEYMHYIREE